MRLMVALKICWVLFAAVSLLVMSGCATSGANKTSAWRVEQGIGLRADGPQMSLLGGVGFGSFCSLFLSNSRADESWSSLGGFPRRAFDHARPGEPQLLLFTHLFLFLLLVFAAADTGGIRAVSSSFWKTKT